MSNNDIDSSKAKEIVSYFLAQSHIVLDVKESVFDDHAWIVDAEVYILWR